MLDYNPYGLSRFNRPCRPVRRPAGGAGLSLVEVMVVVAILAIAGAAAVPNLIDWRHGLRLRAAVNEVRSDLATARARAVKENTQVTVQFLPEEGRYRITCLAPDGVAVLLIKDQWLPAGVRLAKEHPSYTFDSNGHRASFSSRGTAQAGTLVLQNDRGKTTFIVVNYTGRIEIRS